MRMKWFGAARTAIVLAAFCSFPATPAFAQSAAAAYPASSLPAAEATVQSSRDYRIRQGDEVVVSVFGEPTLTPPSPLRVLQGGTIALPLAGNVRVGGLTTAQASRAVAARFHKYLLQPQITVAVYSVGPIEALVLGNVRTPGKFTLPPPARLTDVIAAAGGLGPTDGPLPDARVQEPDGRTRSISLQKLLHDGDTSLNVSVDSGETVYVPSPNVFNVRVVGAVDKPGDVALHDGDDLPMAIARAGTSVNANSDLNRVVVTRTGPDGKTSATTVDLYQILKNGDLSHDIILQKNDLVYVPAARTKSSVAGSVATSLLSRFLYFP